MNDLERLCRIMGTFDLATGHAETMSDALDALEEELKDVLGNLRARREWVGLEDLYEVNKFYSNEFLDGAEWAEAKLKERNT